jgi:hypothetical protein
VSKLPYSKLTADDVSSVWKAFGKAIGDSYANGKGTQVPGFGSFTHTEIKRPIGTRGYRLARSPIVHISEGFAKQHNVRTVSKLAAGHIPVLPLNSTMIALQLGVNKGAVTRVLGLALGVIGDYMRAGHDVDVALEPLGFLRHSAGTHVAGFFFRRGFAQSVQKSVGVVRAGVKVRPSTSLGFVPRTQTLAPARSVRCCFILFA